MEWDDVVNRRATMARVTGVGGIFFKSTGDKAALAAVVRETSGHAAGALGRRHPQMA